MCLADVKTPNSRRLPYLRVRYLLGAAPLCVAGTMQVPEIEGMAHLSLEAPAHYCSTLRTRTNPSSTDCHLSPSSITWLPQGSRNDLSQCSWRGPFTRRLNFEHHYHKQKPTTSSQPLEARHHVGRFANKLSARTMQSPSSNSPTSVSP